MWASNAVHELLEQHATSWLDIMEDPNAGKLVCIDL